VLRAFVVMTLRGRQALVGAFKGSRGFEGGETQEHFVPQWKEKMEDRGKRRYPALVGAADVRGALHHFAGAAGAGVSWRAGNRTSR